jgi:hypothetical protein
MSTSMRRYKTMMIDRSHPIAETIGRVAHPNSTRIQVYVHKFNLYERIGDGPHPCHWCGRELHWGRGVSGATLLADHLDGNHLNNDPLNLAPSCNGCNTIRARSFRPVIEPTELFIVNKDGTRSRAEWCECSECGVEFLAHTSRVKRGTVKTCSRSCSNRISIRKRWG